jgi:hypothetical protein
MPLDEKDRAANEEQAKNSVSVDSSHPVTTVQIRLADGSRLVGQFNHSHTIADVRRFITTYPLQDSSIDQNCKLLGCPLSWVNRNFMLMLKMSTAHDRIQQYYSFKVLCQM